MSILFFVVFFQAEDGIRDVVRYRGLGDVYKRQSLSRVELKEDAYRGGGSVLRSYNCLLYTSDAADDLLFVNLGGRRFLKNKYNSHIFTDTNPGSTPVSTFLP